MKYEVKYEALKMKYEAWNEIRVDQQKNVIIQMRVK